MLLNLSNHPSANWPSEQMRRAQERFGSVLDMPFPEIDPAWSTDQVRMKAEEYFHKIRSIAAHEPVTVHLMGELTFCYMLLCMLHSSGIPAVASTTHRNVVEENGLKTVRFEFKEFRPYYHDRK